MPFKQTARFRLSQVPQSPPHRRAQHVPHGSTGHSTDSMERRYNIVDVEDIRTAKELMEKKPNGE
jgi:hypothetical protein